MIKFFKKKYKALLYVAELAAFADAYNKYPKWQEHKNAWRQRGATQGFHAAKEAQSYKDFYEAVEKAALVDLGTPNAENGTAMVKYFTRAFKPKTTRTK